jgi:hypothetical protein
MLARTTLCFGTNLFLSGQGAAAVSSFGPGWAGACARGSNPGRFPGVPSVSVASFPLPPGGGARCRSPSPASETLCFRWCVTARRKRLREVAIRGTVFYPVGSRFFTPAPGKAAGSDGIRRPHGSRGTACSDDGPRKCRGLVVVTDFSDGYRLGKPYPKKSLPDM